LKTIRDFKSVSETLFPREVHDTEDLDIDALRTIVSAARRDLVSAASVISHFPLLPAVSGSSAIASSTTVMGNGRRYRSHPNRADSFTSNDTASNTRNSRRKRTISASSSASAAAAASHPHPHIRNSGLTLLGFLYLHTIFIQRAQGGINAALGNMTEDDWRWIRPCVSLIP
ncbi:hypothetical protein CF328_g8964, partial [Tilletia controversa]